MLTNCQTFQFNIEEYENHYEKKITGWEHLKENTTTL